MPLHPKAERFLQQMKALGSPSPHKMSPDLARKTQATGYAFFASQLTPIPVGKVEDRTVSTPKRETPIRIYWPQEPQQNGNSRSTAPLPLLVFIHGGGFVLGDLNQYDDMCRRLCDGAQTVVISIDYGLAPEWKFPDPVEECYTVTKWAFEHAEALGCNPKKIAIAGDSAGGNLAAVVCLLARDKFTHGKVKDEDKGEGRGESVPKLCYQVLMYPVVEQDGVTESKVNNGHGFFLEAEDMLWFRDCYLPDNDAMKDPLASPLLATDHADLPSALVITAEYDPLHDEGVAYAEKLREAGVAVVHKNYPGMIHGFMSMTWLFEDAIEAIDLTASTLHEVFYDGHDGQQSRRIQSL